MSVEQKDTDQNDNVTNNTSMNTKHRVTISQLLAACKLYKMVAPSAINKKGFIIPSSKKAIWTDPLYHLYEAVNGHCTSLEAEYTIKAVYDNLSEHDKELAQSLKAKGYKGETEEMRQLKLIYYNMVFDDKFRTEIFKLFGDYDYMHGIMKPSGRLFTDQIITYAGNKCIECGGKLQISFQNSRVDNRGTAGIAFDVKTGPSLCTVFRKKCSKCNIHYYQNRIDYQKDCVHAAKRNRTLFLDPDAFNHFTMTQGAGNTLNLSIFKSIQRHQYCNKPQSIQTWVFHYNEDWDDELTKLSQHIIRTNDEDELLQSTLSYDVVLRTFYFYSLLRRLRDLDLTKETVAIDDDHSVKVALILTAADKKAMEEEVYSIHDVIAEQNDKPKTHKGYRECHHYLEFCVNKYFTKLKDAEISALKKVPVKLNSRGEIEIYPGWFIIYGDGGEKLSRIKCAYPSLLAKYDRYMQAETGAESEEESDSDDEIEFYGDNEEDIDLTINTNGRLYSSARYFECNNTPARNSKKQNGQSIAFKCCRYHSSRMIKEHHFAPADIPLFIEWYHLHSSLATITTTNITATLQQHYAVDDELLKTITTKKKKKIIVFQQAIAKWIKKYPAKHKAFNKFYHHINDKVNSLTQGMSKKKHKVGVTLHRRACTQKGRMKTRKCVQKDMNVAKADRIVDICGSEDCDLESTLFNDAVDEAGKEDIIMDMRNDAILDSYNGCRKTGYFSKATISRTKGLNIMMNTSGVVIELREEPVRETPTTVLLDIVDLLTKNKAAIEYANRVEAIGYDMMCRIYYRVNQLAKKGRLSDIQMSVWFDLIWRAFIDLWHIATHTDKLCIKKTGIFHPELPKFDEILKNIGDIMKRCNDIIAEQFWSHMNGAVQLKSMSKETMFLFLLEKRSYFNKAKLCDIEDEGYTMIPIEWCTELRDVRSKTFKTMPSAEQLKAVNAKPLSKVQVRPEKIDDVKDLIKGNSLKYLKTPKSSQKKLNTTNPSRKRPLSTLEKFHQDNKRQRK